MPLHAGTNIAEPVDPFVANPSRPLVRDEPAPPLDMEKIRELVREDARNYKAPPPTGPSELARLQLERSSVDNAFQDARRPGCQTRYAAMGLLAIIPLLIDTVRDKGCKW